MANVGSGTVGKTLVGNGNGASPTYVDIGTNSGLTAHGLVVAEGTGAFQATGAGSAGQVLQSGGASANPTYSTATYPSIGGTNGTILRSNGTNFINSTATYPATTTANQLLYSSANNVIGGITAAANGVLISSNTNVPSWLANSGTPGFVLTANSGAPPSWQAAGGGAGITSIGGDIGTPNTGPTVDFHGGIAAINSNGMSFNSDGSGNVTLNYPFLRLPETDSLGNGVIYMENNSDNYPFIHASAGGLGSASTYLGAQSGNLVSTSTGNTGIGFLSLHLIDVGTGNTAIGIGSGQSIDDGNDNTCIGASCLQLVSSGVSNTSVGSSGLSNVDTGSNNIGLGLLNGQGITSGSNNIVIGNGSLGGSNGNFNTVIGQGSGNALSGTDSSNTLINANGSSGDNNVLRIGEDGTGDGNINQAFIAGIDGRTVTGTAVLISSSGELGTVVSSRRYKENINKLDKDISILNLIPVEFNYNSIKNKQGECAYKQYGLIAEEVHEAFPYLCFYKDGQPESVKYHELPVLLLHEIQKLKAEIEDLKKSIVKV